MADARGHPDAAQGGTGERDVRERVRKQILESLEQQEVKVNEERLTDVNLIKRLVMKRCVYGVDLNPMAVELAKVARSGCRAVMLYVVQRTDAERFAVARDLDPAYAAACDRAREAGVEMLAYACQVTRDEIAITRRIPAIV